jgi:hypothetical protein
MESLDYNEGFISDEESINLESDVDDEDAGLLPLTTLITATSSSCAITVWRALAMILTTSTLILLTTITLSH